MVEVPGTAPGSDGFIAMAVYRHSRPRGRQCVYKPEDRICKGPSSERLRLTKRTLLEWELGRRRSGRMQQYLELMQKVRETGVHKNDRTGTGTLSIFGRQLR